jgi:hypothetical protein
MRSCERDSVSMITSHNSCQPAETPICAKTVWSPEMRFALAGNCGQNGEDHFVMLALSPEAEVQ